MENSLVSDYLVSLQDDLESFKLYEVRYGFMDIFLFCNSFILFFGRV